MWLKTTFVLHPLVVNDAGRRQPHDGPPGNVTEWHLECVQPMARSRELRHPQYWNLPSPIACMVIVLAA
eukprot:3067854-Amphidinium_carterae.1